MEPLFRRHPIPNFVPEMCLLVRQWKPFENLFLGWWFFPRLYRCQNVWNTNFFSTLKSLNAFRKLLSMSDGQNHKRWSSPESPQPVELCFSRTRRHSPALWVIESGFTSMDIYPFQRVIFVKLFGALTLRNSEICRSLAWDSELNEK